MQFGLTKTVIRLPRRPFLVLIMLYQRTVSPDHGFMKRFFPRGYCRFYPSCSTYGYQAVDKHGIIRGSWLIIWRIMRCNPWSKGGLDELK